MHTQHLELSPAPLFNNERILACTHAHIHARVHAAHALNPKPGRFILHSTSTCLAALLPPPRFRKRALRVFVVCSFQDELREHNTEQFAFTTH